MESILNSIKQLLGVSEEETHFDTDIIIHINSAFSTLNDVGVGPEKTFSIVDEKPIWDDFVEEDDYNDVKTYVYLKVKLLFDPPSSSYVIDAMTRQKDEIEWRLTVRASNKAMEGNDDDDEE